MKIQRFTRFITKPMLDRRRGRLLALLLALATLLTLNLTTAQAQSGDSITSPDTTGNVGWVPAMALDSNGYPVVSYYDLSNDTLKLLHCNDANCAGGDESITSPATAIVPSTGFGIEKAIDLALDSNGYPVISYVDAPAGLESTELKLMHCNDANCSGGDESITTLATDPYVIITSLALDGNGYPVISYAPFDPISNGTTLNVLHCNDANCTGDDESIASPDTIGNFEGGYSSLALDSNGYPVVSYLDATNKDLKVLHCNDANCVGDDESITSPDTGGDVGAFNSLALDSNGYPVVSYLDATNVDLKVLHCNDANCAGDDESITSPDTGGNVGYYTSLALDSNDYPVVSYYDATNKDLKVLRCNDANCAGDDESITTPDPSGDNASFNNSLTLDSNGYPVVSYYDGTNLDLKLLHCNDANCTNAAPIAVNDAYTTEPDTPLTIAAPGVLSNDSDPDGDALTAVFTGDEPRGTVQLNLDGSFTYTPVAGFTGVDSFSYFATDGAANSNIAAVRITIAPACPTFPVTVADEAALNQAIGCFNAITTPGSYTINLDADITFTAAPTTIDNSNDVMLHFNGNDHLLDGAGAYRGLTIAADTQVTVENLTIRNGYTAGSGGGIINSGMLAATNITLTQNRADQRGGGLSNAGTLMIANSTLTHNTAVVGGGLYDQGTLTMTNSIVSNNAASRGGGVSTAGSAVPSKVISNSIISDNTASSIGGGVSGSRGRLVIANSIIRDNTATSAGGGISYQDAPLTIYGSTISGNEAADGGGLAVASLVTVSNSTISNNTATGAGGGIHHATGTLTLINSTLSVNAAASAGGSIYNRALLTLQNTLIANSTSGGDCVNASGAIVSTQSHNLIEDSANACGISDGDNGSIIGQDPNLGPLQDNGGSTLTQALLDGSPAINAGDNSAAVDANGDPLSTDQRGAGFPRIVGGTVDIGAYESPFLPNNAPIATDDTYTADAGVQLDIAAPGVLGNDSDADGDALTAVLVNNVSNGTLTLNADGSFSYMANAGFTGDDSFTYVANDGSEDSNVATVTITVNAAATPFATCGGYDIFETAPGVYSAPSFPGNLMVGTDGYDWLIGTAGPDLILGLQGGDDLWGGDGDDVICGGAGVDIILGQRGNDTLYGDDQPDWLIGGPDNDTLYGGAGWDDLQGDGGQDTLHGEGGLDVLLGGADNDLLLGGDDPDALFGQNGDDALDGGLADDYCLGGRGADTITNCEGASSAGATADEAIDIDEEAARRSNDGVDGENAIEQRIQQVFLPLVSNE